MRFVQSHYCTAFSVGGNVVLNSMSVWCIQGHCTAGLFQFGIYRCIIILQSVSVNFIRHHNCTKVCVKAVCRISLLY